MKIPLDPDVAGAVRFQEYGPAKAIEGVVHRPLKKHRSLDGWFLEHLRVTGGKVEGLPVPFEVRQISLSRATPGRINAFHVHPRRVQDEIWCVVEGALQVWLADVRETSATRGARRPYLLSAEEPALLLIPSGVAHGYKAGPKGALLLYAMNSQFDTADPNEGRLPWDHFGLELWAEDRG
ncbi:MAG: dTDP-4-dehydrorhamnose 3,5-epimerase family protein [Planctomycetes bacterium]|nr:dTDP-4-dehydrorhamnose 3,5-epimerase family protein [Planctomycetota bacterium]